MKLNSDYSDFVVIGGVAAGPKTAAVLARRLPGASITLFQKGTWISYAACGLPYFASGDVDSIDALTRTANGVVRDEEFFFNTRGVTFISGAEVLQIDRKEKVIHVREISTGEIFKHQYQKLVLATGSRPNTPTFPVAESSLIRHFTTPDDAIQFRSLAEKGKIGSAVIVGGGNIGCEVAEACGGIWGIKATVIERENSLLPYIFDEEMAALINKEMLDKGVSVKTGTEVKEITIGNHAPLEVHLSNGESILADYIFLCLGVKPEISLAKLAGLEIGTTGAIKVNKHLQTSDPDIYAGGDCIESVNQITSEPVFLTMGSLANRHGWTIAENLAGNPVEFKGILGAFLVKVFDINAGVVGLCESAALNRGLRINVVWGTFVDKPDYYPESKILTVKMIYEKDSNRLLGLQTVGYGDICRRIDVFSSYLSVEANLYDLLSFEHGYAPPYSEALDPLHHLASLALAQQRGLTVINPLQAYDDNPFLLDVREENEFLMDKVKLDVDLKREIVNIPLGSLRARINELPRNRKIIVACKRGSRSYQAALMLKQEGFTDIGIVGGGLIALP